MKRGMFAALLLFAFCVPARAQYFAIPWFKIGGGAGAMTGGTYYLNATVGQADAVGRMTGGNYSVYSGFWAIALVTTGAPPLNISHSADTVTVYWENVPGWSLQQNSNLATLAGWSASSGVTSTNGTNYLIVTKPAGNLFFRLKGP